MLIILQEFSKDAESLILRFIPEVQGKSFQHNTHGRWNR